MRRDRAPAARVPPRMAGRTIPQRFRDPLLRLESPTAVLSEFIRWFEASAAADGGSRGQLVDTGESDRLRADRDALVAALIDLCDLVDSAALRERSARALERAGVTAFDPVNTPFDASQHRAVERVPAPDARHHAIVAATERLGYSDRGRVIRLPEVLVYWDDAKVDGR